MASVFSRIIEGEIPCYKIAEKSHYLAFLDIAPLTRGHVLVVPKLEEDHWTRLPEFMNQELWNFARYVAIGLKKAVPCERVGVVVAGFDVPHTHIHLIPANSMQDMNFSNPKLQLSGEEMEALATHIRSFF